MNSIESTPDIELDREQVGSEQRRASRRNQFLYVTCSLLRGTEQLPPTTKLRAEVFDLSATGTGLRLDDRNGLLRGTDLQGRYMRLQLAAPGMSKPLTVTAEIRWCRPEDKKTGYVRLGVEFLDPSPEFLHAIGDILAVGKGDQQFLWNLWESYMIG